GRSPPFMASSNCPVIAAMRQHIPQRRGYRLVEGVGLVIDGGIRFRTQASRRAILRAGAATAAALSLGGCASVFGSGSVPSYTSLIVEHPTVLVATTRRAVNGGREKPWFGPERGRGTTIARATLTPPSTSAFA